MNDLINIDVFDFIHPTIADLIGTTVLSTQLTAMFLDMVVLSHPRRPDNEASTERFGEEQLVKAPLVSV